MTTEELFLRWWQESYHFVPGEYAQVTHVAFANYVDSVRRMELLEAMGKDRDLP